MECKLKRNKFSEIILALIENNIDIMAVNETKLKKNDECFYFDNNYNCIFNSRITSGGGVAFFIKKGIEFLEINDLKQFNTECLCIKIKLNKKEIYLINYYNPQTAKSISKCLNLLILSIQITSFVEI